VFDGEADMNRLWSPNITHFQPARRNAKGFHRTETDNVVFPAEASVDGHPHLPGAAFG
jgi:hypothetical protein